MPVDKLTKPECCGCNACGDICPVSAISFETDNEGFWYPKVDYDKCIHCELCTRICPEINIDALKHNDFHEPECYAAENKNLEVVFDSTSGGLFSAFADRMYRDGGFVGGAVFSDDYRSVRQFISPDKSDLPALRSSKYLQSDLQGFYRQVKEILDRGDKVLVCGCPCQMAGLRSFLRKPYDTLLVIDFVCLGINSPLVWRRYLDSFEDRYGSKVIYAKAKSKEYGWRNRTNKIKLADGRVKYETKHESNFGKGFTGTHAYCRPSCYECKFRRFPRISDISLADFWGIEKFDKNLEKNLGTSLVLINSEKGKEWFERIKSRLNYIKVPLKYAIEGNPALIRDSVKPTIDRDRFFEDVKVMPFTEIAEKYGFSGKKVPKITFKNKIKGILLIGFEVLKSCRHLSSSLRTLRYNKIKDILNNRYISFAPNAFAEISPKAELSIKAKFRLGKSRFKKIFAQTKLLVDKNAKLRVENDFSAACGADIEVFSGAELIIKGKGRANVNLTIICGDRIEIGEHVMIGRGVTIRDNNGGHYINRAGYKDSKPVIIGDKCWLCEGCTIMPGVKIGQGAIIGAKAVVTSNVPPYSMVFGNPAIVVDKDVLWKY